MAPDIVSTRKRDHDAVMIWHRADDLPPNVCEGRYRFPATIERKKENGYKEI